MSTAQRKPVPVQLRHSKRYFDRNGTLVRVHENGDRFKAMYPFTATPQEGGIETPYYLTADGMFDPEKPEHPNNIVRPAYIAGEYYSIRGNSELVALVTSVDDDRIGKPYAVNATLLHVSGYDISEDDTESYTLDGLEWRGKEGGLDLMDYAPQSAVDAVKSANVAVNDLKDVPAPQANRFKVGDRVSLSPKGSVRYFATVRFILPRGTVVVEFDDYHGGHSADHGLGTRGWFIEQDPMMDGYNVKLESASYLQEGEDLIPAVAEDVPFMPVEVPPLTVEVTKELHEFGYEDREAVWQAYRSAIRFGRSVTIEQLIAARKKLYED